LIVDSAGSHLNSDIINDLQTKRVVVAIVPKGCTMYVQVLDVSFFSVFKHHYDDVVEEFIDKSESRSKINFPHLNLAFFVPRDAPVPVVTGQLGIQSDWVPVCMGTYIKKC
jgi:hypothetical protein